MSAKLKRDAKKVAESRGYAGVSGRYKRFSPEDYNLHNAPAISAVLAYLDQEGIWARENDDLYGPDIVVYRGLRPVSYIEVEMRKAWTGGEFPRSWNPIHIPERKLHYLKLGLPIEFWVLGEALDQAVVIPDYVIGEFGVLKEFANSRIMSGEMFSHIDLEHCIEKELANGDES